MTTRRELAGRTFRTADGGTLHLRKHGPDRWGVTESGKGGLKGGTIMFRTEREAREYVLNRSAVIRRQQRRR